jgi:hypothetical protein
VGHIKERREKREERREKREESTEIVTGTNLPSLSDLRQAFFPLLALSSLFSSLFSLLS